MPLKNDWFPLATTARITRTLLSHTRSQWLNRSALGSRQPGADKPGLGFDWFSWEVSVGGQIIFERGDELLRTTQSWHRSLYQEKMARAPYHSCSCYYCVCFRIIHLKDQLHSLREDVSFFLSRFHSPTWDSYSYYHSVLFQKETLDGICLVP